MFSSLNNIVESYNSLTNMSCEACTVKFSLFKRKKQCMDCLHYFCAGCVIKRSDRVLSCDNCSMLSRRPLIKSQIIQMKTRHLRNYLEAKKVNIKGCLEKDDLVNLLILYVTETDRLHNRSQRPTNRNDHPGNQPAYNDQRPVYFENSRFQSPSSQRDNVERRVPSGGEARRDQVPSSRQPEPPVPHNESTTPAQPENVPPRSQTESAPATNDSANVEQSHLADDGRNNVERVPDTEPSLVCEELPENSQEGRGSGEPQNIELEQFIVEDVDDLEETQRRVRNAANEMIEIEEVTESDFVIISESSEAVVTESEEPAQTSESTEEFVEVKVWPNNVKLSDIKSSSDLNQLTTKQLKYLLIVNRVDFKGCVERYELRDRVLRLWTEYRQSRKEVENSDVDGLCKICLDAPIECVILECGHMACCIECGKRLADCPICRQYIVRVVRIFRS